MGWEEEGGGWSLGVDSTVCWLTLAAICDSAQENTGITDVLGQQNILMSYAEEGSMQNSRRFAVQMLSQLSKTTQKNLFSCVFYVRKTITHLCGVLTV